MPPVTSAARVMVATKLLTGSSHLNNDEFLFIIGILSSCGSFGIAVGPRFGLERLSRTRIVLVLLEFETQRFSSESRPERDYQTDDESGRFHTVSLASAAEVVVSPGQKKCKKVVRRAGLKVESLSLSDNAVRSRRVNYEERGFRTQAARATLLPHAPPMPASSPL